MPNAPLPAPAAYSGWVIRLLDVQFEPASPLTGEVFDLLIDTVCAHVLDDAVGVAHRRPLGLPTWRERREASRTLYAQALRGHVVCSPEHAGRCAEQISHLARELDEFSCTREVQILLACSQRLERYGLALTRAMRTRRSEDALHRARRITRIERELVASLLKLIQSLSF